MKTHVIQLLDHYPIQIFPHQKTLIMFDIDGVVCRETINLHKPDVKLTPEQIEMEQMSCVCTPEFIKTIQELKKFPNIDIKFNTGRKVSVKEATQQMFTNAGLPINVEKDVTFYPTSAIWEIPDYLRIKSQVIYNEIPQYDKIHYVDDSDVLIEHLQDQQHQCPQCSYYLFKQNPQRISSLKN